jgi:hypothetical protein
MDPTGLAVENFDAIGEYRAQENGAQIDASGTFDGKPYKDVIALEQILHDSPAIPDCLVQRLYEYGVGRPIAAGERDWIRYLDHTFAADGYKFPPLMRRIAMSNAFQTIAADPSGGTVASN